MIDKIKNSWLIVLINVLIVSLYIVMVGFTFVLLVAEAVFLFGFYFKILRDTPSKRTSVVIKNGMLIVKGVFHNFEIEQEKIADVKYKRNLLANIFDWDLIIIKTHIARTSIYVRRSYQIS